LGLGDKDSLSGKASRALGWSFTSTFLSRVVTFGSGVVLARLLGPHAFGAYAVALVALFAMQNFNELGMSLAIVRWESDPREITPTITTISVVISVLAYIGCYAAAPIYSSIMGDPSATNIVRVLALAIVIDGFCNTPSGLLQRQFRQGQNTIALQTGGWIGTGITIALAWYGYGAMSLAIGQVIGSLICMILLVSFAPGSLRMGFNRARARELIGYGLPLAGSNLVAFAVTTVDQLIVGHVLGAEALGFYVLAFNVANWPINIFSRPVRNVTPAIFSRLQHDRAALSSSFLTATGLLSAIGLPLCLLIAGVAEPLVGMVYGSHWLPAAQPLKWLAVLAALRILFELAYDYLVVLARSRLVLVIQIVWILALIPALIIGTHIDGIAGAGAAEAAVAAFAVLPWYMGGLSKAGIKMSALGKQLSMPIVGAIVAGVIATAAGEIARNDFIVIAGSATITTAVVGLLLYRMRPAIAMLRTAAVETEAAAEAAAGEEQPVEDELTAELAAMWGVIDALPRPEGDKAEKIPMLTYGLLSSAGFQRGFTETMPIYRDVPWVLPRSLDTSSPLYRRTTSTMRWDPAREAGGEQKPQSDTSAHRGRADEQDTDPFGHALRWHAAKTSADKHPPQPSIPPANGHRSRADEQDTDPFGHALQWHAAKTSADRHPPQPSIPPANGHRSRADEQDTDPFGHDPLGTDPLRQA
jgi:PST family polysaccharide transporter